MLTAILSVALWASSALAGPDDAYPTDGPSLGSVWNYQGCYDDSVQTRALNTAYSSSQSMTVEACVTFCNVRGYNVAGLEYFYECYCGISTNALQEKDPSECNTPCNGDSDQTCGGPNHLSVYVNTAPGPVTNKGDDGLTTRYAGCWKEGTGSRVLPVGVDVPGGTNAVSVKSCTDTCRKRGFLYAGVEYASECFCGASVAFRPIPHDEVTGLPEETGCNMPCKGNPSEFCGGANRLNVYR
ncbi:WSC-domain-containing protein, partial [Byssothecium circinans]